MPKRDYSETTQTAYSRGYKDLVDPVTGEFVPTVTLMKTVYGSEVFTKTLKTFYEAMCQSFESTQYQVYFYILLKMRKRSNEFVGTYNSVKRATGLSSSTVVKGFRWAKEHDLIRMVSPGIWMVNPHMIAVGDNVQIRKLRAKYDYLERRINNDPEL